MSIYINKIEFIIQAKKIWKHSRKETICFVLNKILAKIKYLASIYSVQIFIILDQVKNIITKIKCKYSI